MERAVGAGGRRLKASKTERGLSSPRLDSGSADRNVRPPLSGGIIARLKWSGLLSVLLCHEGQRPGTIPAWANGPGYRIESLMRAEGPSHWSGMARPCSPWASRCSAPGCPLGPRWGRADWVMGAMMGRPYRAGGIGVSVTWADGPGWYGARRWRWGGGWSMRRGLAVWRWAVMGCPYRPGASLRAAPGYPLGPRWGRACSVRGRRWGAPTGLHEIMCP